MPSMIRSRSASPEATHPGLAEMVVMRCVPVQSGYVKDKNHDPWSHQHDRNCRRCAGAGEMRLICEQLVMFHLTDEPSKYVRPCDRPVKKRDNRRMKSVSIPTGPKADNVKMGSYKVTKQNSSHVGGKPAQAGRPNNRRGQSQVQPKNVTQQNQNIPHNGEQPKKRRGRRAGKKSGRGDGCSDTKMEGV